MLSALANPVGQSALRQAAATTALRPNRALSIASSLNNAAYSKYFFLTTQLAMFSGLAGMVSSLVGGERNAVGRTLGSFAEKAEAPAQYIAENNVASSKHAFSSLIGGAGNMLARISRKDSLADTFQNYAVKTHKFETRAAESLGKSLTEISAKAADALTPHVGSQHAETIRNLPDAIAGANLNKTLFNATVYGGMALNTAHQALGFRASLNLAKDMFHDLTGKKGSGLRILMGQVPEPMKAIRGNLLKQYLLPTALQSASMFLFPKIAQLDGKTKIGAIMASQMLPALYQTFAVQHDVLHTFNAVSELQKSGQTVPAEAYMALIASVDPAYSDPKPKTKQLLTEYAKQAAEQQTPVAEIMKLMQKQPSGESGFITALRSVAAQMAKNTTEAAGSQNPAAEHPGRYSAQIANERTQTASLKK